MEKNVVIKQIVQIDKKENQDWYFSTHAHKDEFEVSFVSFGEFFYTFDNYYASLKKGTVYIKKPGQVHEEGSLSGCAGKEIHIVFKLMEDNKDYPFSKELSVFTSGEFFEVLNSLFDSIVRLGKDDELSARFLAEILTIINRLYNEKKTVEVQQLQKKDLIKAVQSYIDLHYSDDLSLTKLADLFYISSYYLSRKFKQTVKISISEYINSCRIGEAQRLLIFTNMEIKSIVTKCGFNDVHYFYNQFKKATGLTPIQFREQYTKG